MPRFNPYNYEQDAMVVINYRHQLQSGTFEYVAHSLIDHKLNLSVFYPNDKLQAHLKSQGLKAMIHYPIHHTGRLLTKAVALKITP